MSRRFIIILALCALALVAAAAFPWQMASDGPARTLAQRLQRDYGLDVSIRGESTLALLPTPRIKIENVEIGGVGNRLAIRNATLRGDIGFFSLLRGEIVLSDLAVSNAETILDLRGADDGFWARWGAWLQLRGATSPIRQLGISESSLTIRREKHPDIVLEQVNTVIDWPESTAPLTLSGDLRWNGKTITIAKANLLPALLLNGKSSAFALEMSVPEGQLALSGTMHVERGWNIAIDGYSKVRTQSLNALTQWADLPIPLSPLVETFAMEGPISSKRNLISWPSVNIALGEDKVEGSLSFRFDQAGYTVSGTLATDDIDLGNYLPRRFPDAAPLSYDSINRADLDLRLSANAARIGPLKLTDLALGLIVKSDRLEASLGRASLDKGTLKGRLLMTGPLTARDIKLQGAAENLNLARLFAALGREAALSGTARGQIALDGHGATLAEVLAGSHGKAVFSAANGEIRGIDLTALLKQIGGPDKEGRSLAAGGSTAFDSINLGMLVEAGAGLITNGDIRMNDATATLSGDISLMDGAVAVNAIARNEPQKGGDRQLRVELRGPWNAPNIGLTAVDKPAPAIAETPADGKAE